MESLIQALPEPITKDRINFLFSNKGIDKTISEINLEMVKYKLMDSEEGLGWSNEICNEAEIEYKRFLHLIKKYPNSIIVPHKLMDNIWHQHILDTRAYQKDCDIVFGEYLHHFPYFGIRSESDKEDLENAFTETQKIYESEFNESMLEKDSSHCKRACESYCKRACNT